MGAEISGGDVYEEAIETNGSKQPLHKPAASGSACICSVQDTGRGSTARYT